MAAAIISALMYGVPGIYRSWEYYTRTTCGTAVYFFLLHEEHVVLTGMYSHAVDYEYY